MRRIGEESGEREEVSADDENDGRDDPGGQMEVDEHVGDDQDKNPLCEIDDVEEPETALFRRRAGLRGDRAVVLLIAPVGESEQGQSSEDDRDDDESRPATGTDITQDEPCGPEEGEEHPSDGAASASGRGRMVVRHIAWNIAGKWSEDKSPRGSLKIPAQRERLAVFCSV